MKRKRHTKVRQHVLALSLCMSLLFTTIPFTPAKQAEAASTKTTETKVFENGSYTLEDITINAENGKSAVVIKGDVTLTIHGNVTLNGGDACFTIVDRTFKSHDYTETKIVKEAFGVGAGAGIEVSAGASLTLKGNGTLAANGGDAANGQNGEKPTGLTSFERSCQPFLSAGRGGGGAGAGIGSKGADNAESTPGAGNINIADKNLQVTAVGGKGGNGGAGGDGGNGFLYSFEDIAVGSVMSREQYILEQGGWGGQGGGGGGYPAAGIGSGGAAGGNGGNGGSGGTDQSETALLYTFLTYIGTPGWWTCGGGGGGGAGRGYQNGGGGGAGTVQGGEYNPVYGGFHDEVKSTAGKGGGAGEYGTDAAPQNTTVKGNRVTAGSPGSGNGAGGSVGSGNDLIERGKNGGNGAAAGKKADSGNITLTGGTVYAGAGAKTAQNIGSGDGNGTASGKLIIRGGVLTTDTQEGGASLTATKGSQQVYPAVLAPSSYSEGVTNATNIKINGEDWNASRFSPDMDKGKLTIWLPVGEYQADVANNDYIYDIQYNITVTSDRVFVDSTTAFDEKIDIGAGDVVIGAGEYTQGGVTHYGYDKTVPVSGIGASNTITYAPGSGEHKLILQNASFARLDVSTNQDQFAKVTVESQGKENHIGVVNILDDQSNITFTGDEDSEISVDTIQGGMGAHQEFFDRRYNYIKDVAVSYGDSREEAIQALKDAGYSEGIYGADDAPNRGTTTIDLNKGIPRSGYVYLGYKITHDPTEAIYDLLAWYGKDGENQPWDFVEGIRGNTYYRKITTVGKANGDINQGTGKPTEIYLYEAPYDPKQTSAQPLSSLAVVNNGGNGVNYDNYKQTLDAAQYCRECFPLIVTWRWALVNATQPADMTKATKGKNYIYVVFGRSFPKEKQYSNNDKETVPSGGSKVSLIEDSSEYHAGSIVMDSYGKVRIGNIFSKGRGKLVTSSGTDAWNELLKDSFWGTPSLTVNRGYLILDTYLVSERNEITLGYRDMGLNCVDPHWGSKNPPLSSWIIRWEAIKAANCYGSNTIGDVNVNGGTLQIGEDGNGSMDVPAEFGNYSGGTVTVKPGGNLLSGAVQHLKSNQNRVEITGLPRNAHLKQIPNIEETGYIGSFEDQDIWTNENGNYITYLPKNSGSKEVIFTDDDGAAHQYQISADGSGKPASKKVTLRNLSRNYPSENGEDMRIQSKYILDGNELYAHDARYDLILEHRPNGFIGKINLNLSQNVRIYMSGNHVSAIYGKGNLCLCGSGLTVTNEIDLPSVTIDDGSITAAAIKGSVKILGGSVKTDVPIRNAQDKNGAVYQAVIPTWNTSVTVDSNRYEVYGSGHGDNKLYLYVPKDAKVVKAGTKYYTLSFNEGSQTMDVKERLDGDGKIDLSNGSLEILDAEQYLYGGQLYRNINGNQYTITGGSSPANTITVDAGNPAVTLNGVTMALEEGSPIQIKSGSANIILSGKNTLNSKDGAAIHAPEGTTIEISGTGQLNAAGGSYSGVIGGNRSEINGTVIISGGTLELIGSGNPAIGAGSGAETPAKSIKITGGSLNARNTGGGSGLGTTPVNADGAELTKLVMEVESGSNVKLDNQDYSIETAGNDGRLYLYVVPGRHTVVSGGKSYQVVPLDLAIPTHGTIGLFLVDSTGAQIELNNQDMVVEGSAIRLTTTPEKGYGLKSGPSSGIYMVNSVEGELELTPISGDSTEVDLSQWNPQIVTSEDGKNSTLTGYQKEVRQSETVRVGISQKGKASLIFHASGKGMKADVQVNGMTVKTISLESGDGVYEYSWDSAGEEEVTLEFTGEGTVELSQVFLSRAMKVSDVSAEFLKVYTITLPDIKNEEHEDKGYVYVLDGGGGNVIDRNPSLPGIQVFQDTEISLNYLDPDGGSFFDSYLLSSNGKEETVEKNPYTRKVGQDLTVRVNTYEAPYYEVTIPEKVILGDEETEVDIEAVSLKNMRGMDVLNVKIKELDAYGNAVLKRDGADDTLKVPVKSKEDAQLSNGSVVAQFKNNSLSAASGGQIKLQPVQGLKKAGDYSGGIVFYFDYQSEDK